MTASPAPGRVLGILGGMGPFASAEFLHTLYRLNMTEPEQAAPACLLLSDPSIPDRTGAVLAGDTRELAARIDACLARLAAAGAERIVIACVTAHAVLAAIPEARRRLVIPLIDLALAEVAGGGRPHLLLATDGTRRARIFESHPQWRDTASLLRWPEAVDQRRVHESVYRLKAGDLDDDSLSWLAELPTRYGVHGLLFGCTELHLLHRAFARRAAVGAPVPSVVDPLWIAARDLAKLLE